MSYHKVVVCKPYMPAVIYGNDHLSECLYRESVDIGRLLYQYNNLVSTLKHYGVVVEDIQPFYVYSHCDLHVLANITFTRDPVISTHNGIVVGKFRKNVRYFENRIANICYHNIIGQVNAGYIEGGDFYQLSATTCIVAHGNRTNMEGIHSLLNMDSFNIEHVVVVSFPENHDMHFIHLDCYFGMAGEHIALLWEGATHLVVDEYVRVDTYMDIDYVKPKYVLNTSKPRRTFKEYLLSSSQISKIIEIPTMSQRKYGCNVLTVSDNVVLVQEEYVYNALMMEPDIVATYIEFSEFHKMYGGIRCATQVCYLC